MTIDTTRDTLAVTAASGARPRIHFAPRSNWMNDPNGLVYDRGLYHLYYQYNPGGVSHANVSWGHATSTDLAQWIEHEPAILSDGDTQIFSGSVVVDHGNTSGFGTAEDPALVAIYTSATPGHQAQALAYSTDGGYAWTKYVGNPVLDRGTSDFRDPKVFRYDDGAEGYWVMVAVEAEDRQVLFYRSDDLKRWTFLSSYGPAGPVGGVWECPDLFPLAVDDDASDVRWVLLISMNPGGIAGGSGTHYVVGDFDGAVFRPDASPSHPAGDGPAHRAAADHDLGAHGWFDFGPDCYAGVTFNGLAPRDRTLIAWMSNWDYADKIITDDAEGRRSAMTLPRRLALTRDRDGPVRLRQEPLVTLETRLLLDRRSPTVDTILTGELGRTTRVRFTAELDDATQVVLRIGSTGTDAPILISQDRVGGRVELHRQAPGMPADFNGSASMPVDQPDRADWDLWIETINAHVSSLELFAHGGRRVLTALIPALESCVFSLAAVGGAVRDVRWESAGVS